MLCDGPKLEAANPFAQNQYQDSSRSGGHGPSDPQSMGDSLNFESSFWQDSLQPAIANNTAYDDVSHYNYDTKPSTSAYDDDNPPPESQPKANPITSILSNMKTKLIDNDNSDKSNGAQSTTHSYTAPAYDPPGSDITKPSPSTDTKSSLFPSNPSMKNMVCCNVTKCENAIQSLHHRVWTSICFQTEFEIFQI